MGLGRMLADGMSLKSNFRLSNRRPHLPSGDLRSEESPQAPTDPGAVREQRRDDVGCGRAGLLRSDLDLLSHRPPTPRPATPAGILAKLSVKQFTQTAVSCVFTLIVMKNWPWTLARSGEVDLYVNSR